MKREFFGIPVWIYGIGAVVVVGGYLWIKHKQNAAAPAAGSGSAQPYKSTSSIKEDITETQSPPTPGHKKHGGGPGPEREWLIHKTGSQHPWTFLRRHHERIVVGPDGSRKIVKA